MCLNLLYLLWLSNIILLLFVFIKLETIIEVKLSLIRTPATSLVYCEIRYDVFKKKKM